MHQYTIYRSVDMPFGVVRRQDVAQIVANHAHQDDAKVPQMYISLNGTYYHIEN